MVTAFPVRPGMAARRSPLVRFLEKYFYFSMSLLIAAIVIYGFSQTIGDNLFHPRVPRPVLLAVHAACFSAWVAFFIFQSALVRTHNVRLHKLTGWFGVVLAASMIPLGISVAVIMARFHVYVLHQQDAIAFLIVPLTDISAFTCTVIPAILLRRKTELHRHFIYISTCVLTSAAWGRFPTNFFPPVYFYTGVDVLILLGMARDLVVTRRIHKTYLYALPLLFAGQYMAAYVFNHQPQFWMRISRAIIG